MNAKKSVLKNAQKLEKNQLRTITGGILCCPNGGSNPCYVIPDWKSCYK